MNYSFLVLIPLGNGVGGLHDLTSETMDIFHMDLTFNLLTINLILENKTTKTNKQKTFKSTIFEQYNGYLKTNLYA